MPRTRAFPRADLRLTQDLYDLGRLAVFRHAELSREEIRQSLAAAVMAYKANILPAALLGPTTRLCGPRKPPIGITKKKH